MMNSSVRLTSSQRSRVFDKTVKRVKTSYFDPAFNGRDWAALTTAARKKVVALSDADEFELAMHALVRKLGTSHTGFFHKSVKRVPARLSIGATFYRVEVDGKRFWAVQDIHKGGPGEKAGVMPDDKLISIGGRNVDASEQPMFPMGAEVAAWVLRGSKELNLKFSIPNPRTREQPYSELQAVEHRVLSDDIGYLKVSIFPGLLGLDVARDLDKAFDQLRSSKGLILDLRGHLGGGLGVLRLMSHLTPDKLPIGYTITRQLRARGFEKSALRRLDVLPTHLPNRLAILKMAAQFAGRDPSILLISEGLGAKRWHGRLVVLVNEHTASAGEMVAAFVKENKLGQIVGTETAGRLIPGSGFKVGHGYMLIMPKAEYVTWHGQRFEGRGVEPDMTVARNVRPNDDDDPQLEMAKQICLTEGSRFHAAPY